MKKYRLKNLDCPDCAAKLEAALWDFPGVSSVSLDFSTQTMLLDCSDVDQVRAEITRLEPEVQFAEMDVSEEGFSEVQHYRRELFLSFFRLS